MANTITDLKDVKIAQTALLPWVNSLVPLAAFSTNFSADIADVGDTVKVPVIGASTVSSDYDGDYTKNADSDISSVSVELNRHKYKTVHLTGKEAASLSMKMLENLAFTAAQQLAVDMMVDIFSCVTAANFGNDKQEIAEASAFSYSDILTLRAACGKENMPLTQRSLILGSGLYNAILGDAVVSQSSIASVTGRAITDAHVHRIAGFDLYETTAPFSDVNLGGFAVHPNAIAVAMRYLQPVVSYEEAGAVTDPVSGMTLGYKRFSDTVSDKVYIVFEALYGFKVLKKGALHRITFPPA